VCRNVKTKKGLECKPISKRQQEEEERAARRRAHG
jgi:hypothetical protein